jgi:hypothetical protein
MEGLAPGDGEHGDTTRTCYANVIYSVRFNAGDPGNDWLWYMRDVNDNEITRVHLVGRHHNTGDTSPTVSIHTTTLEPRILVSTTRC